MSRPPGDQAGDAPADGGGCALYDRGMNGRPAEPELRVERVLREGAAHKARVVVARWRGVRCVVKDLAPMSPWLRRLYGRRQLAREARLLEKLAGTGLAPRLLARLGRDALAVEFVPARHKYLRRKIPRDEMREVLEHLRRTVARMHRLGVVHLDLRQRKNILIPRRGQVVLVDFESARDLSGPLARRTLLPLLARIDESAVSKWWVEYLPDEATAEDRARVRRHRRLMALWPWKRLGRLLRRLFGDDRARHASPVRRGPEGGIDSNA